MRQSVGFKPKYSTKLLLRSFRWRILGRVLQINMHIHTYVHTYATYVAHNNATTSLPEQHVGTSCCKVSFPQELCSTYRMPLQMLNGYCRMCTICQTLQINYICFYTTWIQFKIGLSGLSSAHISAVPCIRLAAQLFKDELNTNRNHTTIHRTLRLF